VTYFSIDPDRRIVFCDFDGMIACNDVLVLACETFAPEVTAQVMPQLYNLELSLRVGVRQLVEAIPSDRYGAMLELARSQPLRSGLRDLIEFLDGQGVEFVVVSGGIRGMVEAALGDLADRVVGIHAMDVDTTGEYLAVRSEFEGEVELVDKLKVVSRYLGTPLPAGGFTNENWIAIGDSVTDLNMALAAPTVFARSRLKTYLDDRGKVYTPYESFFEVRDQLAQLWNVPIFAGLYSSIK
jgi:2-hydroxy-3-keto-5-methylthiopentenyl-1-phosphate phosphatase